jgi:hypothetical protein
MAELRLPAEVVAAELVHEEDGIAAPAFLVMEPNPIVRRHVRHRSLLSPASLSEHSIARLSRLHHPEEQCERRESGLFKSGGIP